MRHLVIVLGDQLDPGSAALDGFDPSTDALWLAEVEQEATHVWSAKSRIAIFLAAMRHFRDEQRAAGKTVHYRELSPRPEAGEPISLAQALRADAAALRPEALVVVEPGEHRVRAALLATATELGIPLRVRPDRHFLCTVAEFAQHAAGRKRLRMEHFYRWMRRRHGVLLDGDGPVGGVWNLDAQNREAFGASGPGEVAPPIGFPPDEVTAEVLALVASRFADHPGDLEAFDWPVTRQQARAALEDFVANRLAKFGRYQDAMWSGEPYLFHARLAAALNLKLLDPREAIAAAQAAWAEGRAPLAAVEGFVRQVLGWREFVRGVYWTRPLHSRNALGAQRPLPAWYWTGDTPMACLAEALGQTLRLGYAHHIQRLMVTGLFAQLLGVAPRAVHEWYLAVYVDAVEWAELPNVVGMSQFADGGMMTTKPYVATGRYIDRMSNACSGCRFDPAARTGADACPFTTLYWDFLLRHADLLEGTPRMGLQLRNAARLDGAERAAIAERAEQVRDIWG